MSKTQTVGAGFPTASIVTIIFILAKLTGKIAWSWWWVFAPLWISAALALTIVGLVLLFVFVAALVE
jgi:transmembrane Fragile-X-F protein